MSWHLEVCGSKEDVTAAIDESAAQSGGMPSEVASYLKGAVAACTIDENSNVIVKSNGHRPMANSGAQEEATVRVLRAKPWKPTTT